MPTEARELCTLGDQTQTSSFLPWFCLSFLDKQVGLCVSLFPRQRTSALSLTELASAHLSLHSLGVPVAQGWRAKRGLPLEKKKWQLSKVLEPPPPVHLGRHSEGVQGTLRSSWTAPLLSWQSTLASCAHC